MTYMSSETECYFLVYIFCVAWLHLCEPFPSRKTIHLDMNSSFLCGNKWLTSLLREGDWLNDMPLKFDNYHEQYAQLTKRSLVIVGKQNQDHKHGVPVGANNGGRQMIMIWHGGNRRRLLISPLPAVLSPIHYNEQAVNMAGYQHSIIVHSGLWLMQRCSNFPMA